MLAPWKKSFDKPREHIKKQRHYFADQAASSKSYGFSSSHVWMWELDYKKAEHWRTDAFELCWSWCWRRLLSPLDCKEIQPVHCKGNQCWIFIGRTDAEAEAPILWPPDAKNWLIGKDPDAGKDWRQEEKGTKQDELVGWHHWLDGHEFEQAPGVGDGKPGVLQSLGLESRHNWATELNWTDCCSWLFWISKVDCCHLVVAWPSQDWTGRTEKSVQTQRPKITFTYSLVFYHFLQATMSKNKYITCPFSQFS